MKHEHHTRRRLLQWALVIAALGVLTPQFVAVLRQAHYLNQINPAWLLAALLYILISCLFAAISYVALAGGNLSYHRTVLTQLASLFANRILPSGLGGLGLNALFLSKSLRISKAEAATMASANNLLGFLVFNIWLLVAGVQISSTEQLAFISPVWLLGTVIVILVAGFVLFKHTVLLQFLRRAAREIAKGVYRLLANPTGLALSFISNAGITVCYVAALWCSLQALGLSLAIAKLILIFALANIVLSVSPTPSGVGPTELAMTGALTAAGIEAPHALLVVLSFRLSTIILPLIPGYFAFRYITRHGYLPKL